MVPLLDYQSLRLLSNYSLTVKFPLLLIIEVIPTFLDGHQQMRGNKAALLEWPLCGEVWASRIWLSYQGR